LATADVRIEAPIPGKALVGIEVPNTQTETVTLRGLLEKTDFFNSHSRLLAGVGLTITGDPTLMDLAKMPHVLIAGATGAEKLLGKGDMLYSPVGSFKTGRVQGVYVSEKEVKAVVQFLKAQGAPTYVDAIMDVEPLSGDEGGDSRSDRDELFDEAKQIIMSTQYASTSYLQRKLRIGYNRAARLMEELEQDSVVGAYIAERKRSGQ